MQFFKSKFICLVIMVRVLKSKAGSLTISSPNLNWSSPPTSWITHLSQVIGVTLRFLECLWRGCQCLVNSHRLRHLHITPDKRENKNGFISSFDHCYVSTLGTTDQLASATTQGKIFWVEVLSTILHISGKITISFATLLKTQEKVEF